MSPVKKIIADKDLDKKIKPTQEIFEEVLNFAKSKGIDTGNKLFAAELYNTTAKSAAEAYFTSNLENSNPLKMLTASAEYIKAKSASNEEGSDKFLTLAGQFIKNITFTPHPDFVIMKGGMFASRLLKECYAEPEFVEYLSGKKNFSELNDNNKEKLYSKIKNLYEKITEYPTKSLTPKEESAMLVKNSENVFDSHKITIDIINNVHKNVFGFEIPLHKAAELIPTALYVWRDQDSKPEVTASRISHSDQFTAVVGMQQLYSLYAASIMQRIDKNSDEYKNLKKILVKTLNAYDNPLSIEINNKQFNIPDEADRYKKLKEDAITEFGAEGAKAYNKELRDDFREKYFPNFNRYLKRLTKAVDRPNVTIEAINILKDAHKDRVDNLRSDDYRAYSTSTGLHEDLMKILAESEGKVPDDARAKIAEFAGLAKQFGLRALISENRQNQKQFKQAFDFLKSQMLDSEELSGIITKDDDVKSILIKSENNPAISKFTRGFLSKNKDFFEDIGIKLQGGMEISEADNNRYLMLDILYTREYYSNLMDTKRSLVIAESNSVDNFRHALLFETLTKSPANIKTPVTEIKYLFENKDDVYIADKIIEETLKDKILEKYQAKVYKTSKVMDVKTGEMRNKTVADMKREKGLLDILAEDEKTDLKGKIIIMTAGSDSNKTMSAAAKYILEYQKYQIAKIAAKYGYDVEFKKGNGPHPGRDSGENLDMDQTTQGIETNNSPMNFSYRSLNFMAHKMGQSLGLRLDKEKGDIDFGNQGFSKRQFVEFELNQERSKEIYEGYKNGPAKTYSEFYEKGIKGSDKKNLLDNYFDTATLNQFCQFTNLAARGVSRVKSADKGLVKGARAIGFNEAQAALLNHLVYQVHDMVKISGSVKDLYKDCKTFSILHETFFNQVTFGVMSANVESQWRLIDAGIERIKKNGVVKIKIGGDEYATSSLAKMNADTSYKIKNFLTEKYKDSKNPADVVEKIMDSIFIAANADRKYSLAQKYIGELWKEYAYDNEMITKKEYKSRTLFNNKNILKLIPKEYADSLNHIRIKAQEAIADNIEIKQLILTGKAQLPVKTKNGIVDPDNLYPRIYENMGAIKTYHEYTPSSIEIKGKALDLQRQINLAQGHAKAA